MFYIILVYKNFRLTVDFFEGLYWNNRKLLCHPAVLSKVEVAQDRWHILVEHKFLRWNRVSDWGLINYLFSWWWSLSPHISQAEILWHMRVAFFFFWSRCEIQGVFQLSSSPVPRACINSSLKIIRCIYTSPLSCKAAKPPSCNWGRARTPLRC